MIFFFVYSQQKHVLKSGSENEENGHNSSSSSSSYVSSLPVGKTLFVANLPFDMTESSLEEVFNHFGKVILVKLDTFAKHLKKQAHAMVFEDGSKVYLAVQLSSV